MKRLVCLLICGLMIFSLLGCTDNTSSSDSTKICRGNIKDNTYTSDYTGLCFTKPDNWRYLNDKELAQALSISEETISKKEFASSLEEYPSLLDMMVMDDEAGLNMTIGYENLMVTMGKIVTEAEYIEAITEYMATMGNIEASQSQTVTLSQKDYLKTSFSVEIDGTEMKSDYYIRVTDNFMNVITVAYTADITNVNIEEMFS